MPKDKISQYAFTPAANTDIGGINIDEGCAPSGINNAIRTLMTQIRDLQAGVSGDTVPLTAGGTGSGTAASARAALGLAIGTNVLGYVTPGASGNILLSDGSNWTSVAQSAVITLDTITGGPLALAKGGTNATTAAQARTNLNALEYVTAGATGQVLTSTGTGWASQASSGGQFKTELFATPGPATWTNPGAVTQVRVTVIGGGGGGGVSPGVPTTSGPAGSGGYAYANFTIPTSPVTVTVGAGGAAKVGPGGGAGSSGSSSSFGPYISATGGAGGPTATTPATPGSGTISAPALPGAIRIDFAGGLRNIPGTNPAAVAYSYDSPFSAGSAGTGSSAPGGNQDGGVGGYVLVEFVG
jgi:hypothetical protein